MRCVWLVLLTVQISRDSYISAVPKGEIKDGRHHELAMQKQRFRHKNLANTDIVNAATEDDKKLVIAQALPVRVNRTKSTLDKLVREPELGRTMFVIFEANYY